MDANPAGANVVLPVLRQAVVHTEPRTDVGSLLSDHAKEPVEAAKDIGPHANVHRQPRGRPPGILDLQSEVTVVAQ
jgi:hypothetical protein